MTTAESLEDAAEIVSASIPNGKISRLRLITSLAEALDTALCRSCKTVLVYANTIDRESIIDRHWRIVSGRRLSGQEWWTFEHLYMNQRPVSYTELVDSGILQHSRDRDTTHHMRVVICVLRRKLCGSPFEIVTRRGYREPSTYELVIRDRKYAEAAE